MRTYASSLILTSARDLDYSPLSVLALRLFPQVVGGPRLVIALGRVLQDEKFEEQRVSASAEGSVRYSIRTDHAKKEREKRIRKGAYINLQVHRTRESACRNAYERPPKTRNR